MSFAMDFQQPSCGQPWVVDQIVEVRARTWAGINRLGGCGRIVKIHQDHYGKVTSLDVKYLLHNGRDFNVDVAFVQPAALQAVGRPKRSDTKKPIIAIEDVENTNNSKRVANKKKKLSEPMASEKPNNPLPKIAASDAMGIQPTQKRKEASDKTTLMKTQEGFRSKSKPRGIVDCKCERKMESTKTKSARRKRSVPRKQSRHQNDQVKQSNSSHKEKIDAVPVEIFTSSMEAVMCSPLSGTSDHRFSTTGSSIRESEHSSPPTKSTTLAQISMAVSTLDAESPLFDSADKVTKSTNDLPTTKSDHDVQAQVAKTRIEESRGHLTLRALKKRDALEAGAFIENVTGTKTDKHVKELDINVLGSLDHSKLEIFSSFLREILAANEDEFEEKALLTEIVKISATRNEAISLGGNDIAKFLTILASQDKIYRCDGIVYSIN